MSGILRSLYCLPCVWSLIGGAGIFFTVSYYLNRWLPFMGTLPVQGPVDGFLSKTDKKEFFDTEPTRIRAAAKAGFIVFLVWLVGVAILYFILLHK